MTDSKRTVSIFKSGATLSAQEEDELRGRLKEQIAEGVVVLDGTLDFLVALDLPVSPAEVALSTARDTGDMRDGSAKLPKWRYEFDCRKCDNIREIHDTRKHRDGDYCVACVERADTGRKSPIISDEKERVVRCECFTPIPEDSEEATHERM